MINEVDILHECHSGDFACHVGKEFAGLFCIISYHHQRVVELGENRLYPFSELFVSPSRRSPVFLIQPIGYLKSDVCDIKKVLLHLCAEITFVAKYHAVVIFPPYILEVMEVVNACRRHVVRMDNASYSADCMEFISIIIHPLRCTIAPVWCLVRVIASHCTAFCPYVLTYLYRLGVDAENIFPSINGGGHIPTYFLGQPCRQLASGIELPAADQVWQIFFAFMMQMIKQIVFAVEVERLGCESQSDYFKVGEFRNDTATENISEFITRWLSFFWRNCLIGTQKKTNFATRYGGFMRP